MKARTRGHTITRTAWARRRRKLAELKAQRRQRAKVKDKGLYPVADRDRQRDKADARRARNQ